MRCARRHALYAIRSTRCTRRDWLDALGAIRSIRSATRAAGKLSPASASAGPGDAAAEAAAVSSISHGKRWIFGLLRAETPGEQATKCKSPRSGAGVQSCGVDNHNNWWSRRRLRRTSPSCFGAAVMVMTVLLPWACGKEERSQQEAVVPYCTEQQIFDSPKPQLREAPSAKHQASSFKP